MAPFSQKHLTAPFAGATYECVIAYEQYLEQIYPDSSLESAHRASSTPPVEASQPACLTGVEDQGALLQHNRSQWGVRLPIMHSSNL